MQTLESLSYLEMSELAYFGAKVLHPKTILPALERGIPIRIKNTFNPTHPGTIVVGRSDEGGGGLKGVTAIRAQSLVTIAGRGMLGVPGIAARAFGAVARTGTSVSMISQASSEQSICFLVAEKSAATVIDALRRSSTTSWIGATSRTSRASIRWSSSRSSAAPSSARRAWPAACSARSGPTAST